MNKGRKAFGLKHFSEKTGDDIRERVARKLNIPVENIMLCASHTHSGPQAIKEHAGNDPEIEKAIDSYMENVTDKIVTISSQAGSLDFKGKLYAATFTAYMGYNRRYAMKNEKGNDTVKHGNIWILKK